MHIFRLSNNKTVPKKTWKARDFGHNAPTKEVNRHGPCLQRRADKVMQDFYCLTHTHQAGYQGDVKT